MKKKVNSVDDEIKELEAKLRIKQAEREEYATRLQAASDEIAKFSARYTTRLTTAQAQADACQTKLTSIEAAGAKIQEAKRVVDVRVCFSWRSEREAKFVNPLCRFPSKSQKSTR